MNFPEDQQFAIRSNQEMHGDPVLTPLPAGILVHSKINVCGCAKGPGSNRVHSITRREWNPRGGLTHIPPGINALILASNMAAGAGSAGGVSLARAIVIGQYSTRRRLVGRHGG
jgi:hypothetical protein